MMKEKEIEPKEQANDFSNILKKVNMEEHPERRVDQEEKGVEEEERELTIDEAHQVHLVTLEEDQTLEVSFKPFQKDIFDHDCPRLPTGNLLPGRKRRSPGLEGSLGWGTCFKEKILSLPKKSTGGWTCFPGWEPRIHCFLGTSEERRGALSTTFS